MKIKDGWNISVLNIKTNQNDNVDQVWHYLNIFYTSLHLSIEIHSWYIWTELSNFIFLLYILLTMIFSSSFIPLGIPWVALPQRNRHVHIIHVYQDMLINVGLWVIKKKSIAVKCQLDQKRSHYIAYQYIRNLNLLEVQIFYQFL